MIDDLLQDTRYAVRRLRRDTNFAVLAILIASLGIGASVTVFSISDALLIRPLPFRAPERLVWIGNGGPTGTRSWSTQVNHFKDLAAQNTSFEELGAYFGGFGIGGSNLTSSGDPERLSSVLVTQSFFHVLGVQPVVGRNFTDEEGSGTGPRVALMSHGLWVRRFASDPGIVGRALTINDAPVTVVGVLPESFDFGSVFAPGNHIDLFSPFPLIDATNRMGNTLVIVGRLKDGVTIGAATAEVKTLGKQLSADHPSPERNVFNPNLATLRQHVSGSLRSAMTLLAFTEPHSRLRSRSPRPPDCSSVSRPRYRSRPPRSVTRSAPRGAAPPATKRDSGCATDLSCRRSRSLVCCSLERDC